MINISILMNIPLRSQVPPRKKPFFKIHLTREGLISYILKWAMFLDVKWSTPLLYNSALKVPANYHKMDSFCVNNFFSEGDTRERERERERKKEREREKETEREIKKGR